MSQLESEGGGWGGKMLNLLGPLSAWRVICETLFFRPAALPTLVPSCTTVGLMGNDRCTNEMNSISARVATH